MTKNCSNCKDSSNCTCTDIQVPTIVDINYPTSYPISEFCKTQTRGCGKRCPCRTWINCHYYNNSRWKELRGDENILFKEINEWYENFFKYIPGLPDATYANG